MSDSVVFEDWESVLKAAVPPDRQRGYREAIVKFRYWLREKGKQPVVETFKEHLAWKQSYLSPERFAIRREALRWYYKAGTERMWERAVPHGPAEAKMPEAKADVPGGGVRLTPTTPAKSQAPVVREALNANAKPLPPSGVPSAREARVDGYRVYGMNDVPTAGAKDLGGPPWEQALVRRIREKNLAWKSEKTYRGWCPAPQGQPLNS